MWHLGNRLPGLLRIRASAGRRPGLPRLHVTSHRDAGLYRSTGTTGRGRYAENPHQHWVCTVVPVVPVFPRYIPPHMCAHMHAHTRRRARMCVSVFLKIGGTTVQEASQPSRSKGFDPYRFLSRPVPAGTDRDGRPWAPRGATVEQADSDAHDHHCLDHSHRTRLGTGGTSRAPADDPLRLHGRAGQPVGR